MAGKTHLIVALSIGLLASTITTVVGGQNNRKCIKGNPCKDLLCSGSEIDTGLCSYCDAFFNHYNCTLFIGSTCSAYVIQNELEGLHCGDEITGVCDLSNGIWICIRTGTSGEDCPRNMCLSH